MPKLARITVVKRKDGNLYAIRRAGKSYGSYRTREEAQRVAAKDRIWWKKYYANK